ncbi:protein anon-37Cs [Drosophila eugracilis]|uniref:protein anon-37Cs n=1 Tax=Drosophila eugracilis TaxID=29029 RepID=UPI001BDAE6D8|nr:protein anon-37Cs [Drosophila eugracilis]
MQCYKLASRRSLYNARVLQADQIGEHHHSRDLEAARQNARIVVVGAGLAGLSAAQHLLSHGFRRTVVLEATERYGGRINTQRFGDTYCELGAKWVKIDGSQDSMYELLRNTEGLGKQIKQPVRTTYVKVEQEGCHIKPAMVELIDTLFRQLCRGFKLSDRVKTGGDLQSLDNVMNYFRAESDRIIGASFQKPEDQLAAREIFQSLFKEFGSVLGCCLEYVNIEHITKSPVQQEKRPLYVPTGLDNVVDDLIQQLDKQHLQTGKPVGQIQWTPAPLKSVGCLDGSLYSADHIICTLPLGVLKSFAEILFRPTLPLDKMLAIRNLGFGNPLKIYMSYKKPISRWLKSNLRPLGTLLNSSLKKTPEHNWTQQVVEISQVQSSQHVLEVRMGGGYYEEIEKLPDDKLMEQITGLLRRCISKHLVPYPQELLRSNWSSSACYLGGRPYFSISSSARDVQRLAAPLGEKSPSLLFAGDATSLNGFGTIDAARSSGIREAQRIIDFYRNSKHRG